MEYTDRTPSGLRIVRRTEYSEDEIMEDFKNALQIKRNGKVIENKVFDISNPTQMSSIPSDIPTETNSDAPMDPAAFFGSSLSGLIKK